MTDPKHRPTRPQQRSLILRASGASLVDLDARTCTFPFSSVYVSGRSVII